MYRQIAATMLHLISPKMRHQISAIMYQREGEKTPLETYLNPTKKKSPDHWVTRRLNGNGRVVCFFIREVF